MSLKRDLVCLILNLRRGFLVGLRVPDGDSSEC